MELLARQQQIGETLEQYAINMMALFKRVAIAGNLYPEITKIRMFVKGLHPELASAIRPFMFNSLYEAIDQAR
ncbi:8076_t:CDS:1, partial [Racocetra fulgida]